MEQWADSNSRSLIHNAKSFNSAIWKNGYNPDLIFVSSNISDMCEKSFLGPAHKASPYMCDCKPGYCATTHHIQNTRKANWDGFSTEFDEVNSNYIPGRTEESKSLYEAYKRPYSSNPFDEGTLETGTQLIDTMKKQKRMNGRRSSRRLN